MKYHHTGLFPVFPKEQNGLVSILIPVFNTKPQHLLEAVDSCVKQTYKHKEIVLVDDGSTSSDTLYVLDMLADNDDISVVYLDKNSGISKALNIGLEYCKSNYVARMDSDDIMIENRIELQMDYFKSHPDVVAVGGQSRILHNDKEWALVQPLRVTKEQFNKRMWLVCHSAVTYKKNIVKEVGGYTFKNGYPEDLELWYRMVSRGYRIDNLGNVVLKYRREDDGTQLAKTFVSNTNIIGRRIKQFYDSNEKGIMTAIPKKIHFIFGLAENFGDKPFSLVHYLAVKSAHDLNPDFDIFVYYQYEPQSKWWELTKEFITPVKVDSPKEIYGNKLYHVAHKADVLRLELLYWKGGIYLDIDTICKKPFDDELLNNLFVIGKEYVSEQNSGLCNGVIMSVPHHPFVSEWIKSYKTFRSKGFDEYWAEHSVKMPAKIIQGYLKSTTILPETAFHSPAWNVDGLKDLFERVVPTDNYVHHLWESLSWDKYLKNLTPTQIISTNSTYNIIARKFLPSNVIFNDIAERRVWGSSESMSGVGSEIKSTTRVRSYLQSILEKYNISSVLDLGCGDFNWMSKIEYDKRKISYRGVDVSQSVINYDIEKYSSEYVGFECFDYSSSVDELDSVDLIICRDMLQHISNKKCLILLEKMKRSAKYLLLTTYSKGNTIDIQDGMYRSLDLTQPPFSLRFNEIIAEDIFNNEFGRSIGLLKL